MSKFALLFLLVFFGGIYSALVYNGAFAFVVYEIIYFINPGVVSTARWWNADLPSLRYSFIMVIIMIGILIKNYKKLSQESPWSQVPAFYWMAALLFMYYVAYLFALHIPMHSQFTFELTKLIVIIFIAYKLIDSEKMFDFSLWAYLIGCSYIGYLATTKGRSGGRVEGVGMIDAPDSNDTAAALAPAAVILMYYLWKGSTKTKALVVCVGAFIANGLVLINSRGSFLGIVASLGIFLLYMIFSKYQEKGQRGTAIFLVLCGMAGALYITDDVFWERMGTLKEQDVEDTSQSGAGRVQFWLKTFDMLEDHPMGMGIYGYNVLAPIYMDSSMRGNVEFRSVHSMWFQGLSEVGWIGMGIFFGMLTSLYKISKKSKNYLLTVKNYNAFFKILALECALLAYLVSGTFINRFRAEILYWMILFLAVAIKLYYLQAKKRESN